MPAGRKIRVGRLTKRPEYLRVAAAKRKWVTPGMVVQARTRPKTGARDRDATNPDDDRTPPAAADAASSTSGDRGGRESGAVDPGSDSGADLPRVGITVSRKVGNAVQRNRARRRLRAAAREVLPDAGAPGTDYVLIGRAGTLTRSYDGLLSDLKQAVAKLNRPRGEAGERASGEPGARPQTHRRRRGKRGGRGTGAAHRPKDDRHG